MSEQPERNLTDEQAKIYAAQCNTALTVLLGGPKVWGRMPSQVCKPENIGGYIEAGIKNPNFLTQSTIRNGANVAHGLIESMVLEMEAWAKENGRDDLLIPMSQKIEDAILADLGNA